MNHIERIFVCCLSWSCLSQHDKSICYWLWMVLLNITAWEKTLIWWEFLNDFISTSEDHAWIHNQMTGPVIKLCFLEIKTLRCLSWKFMRRNKTCCLNLICELNKRVCPNWSNSITVSLQYIPHSEALLNNERDQGLYEWCMSRAHQAQTESEARVIPTLLKWSRHLASSAGKPGARRTRLTVLKTLNMSPWCISETAAIPCIQPHLSL